MRSQGIIQRHFLPLALLLTTVGITPWFSIEPINSVKFFLLTAAGFLSLGLLIQEWKYIATEDGQRRALSVLWVGFVFAAVVVFFLSEIGWRQQLFGNVGRNTGLIFYLSIAFISIYTINLTTELVENSVFKVFQIAGTLSILYGFVQLFDLDPIPWNNPYGDLIGFQGNPNFQSSFLGLYGVYLVYQIIYLNEFGKVAIFSTLSLISSVSLILLSQSIQGLFVLIIGAASLVLFRLKESKFRNLYYPYLVLVFTCFALSTLGLLQKGPLQFLYQPSVSFRGDYWRAGLKMFQDSPVIGLGHSSFGDYYMSYRDSTSLSGIDGRGPDTFSNSAHNILIDIASSGGLLLTIPYLLLILASFNYIFRVYSLRNQVDRKNSLYSALWVAYLLQTLISVQFITLAFWGWVFLGLLVRNLIEVPVSRKGFTKPKIHSAPQLKASSKGFSRELMPAVFLTLGILVGILPLRATNAQKSALESKDLTSVINAGFIEPQDSDRMNQIALVLAKGNQIEAALRILYQASLISPRNHDTWNLISKLTPEGSAERIQAEEKVKILNPFALGS